MATMGRNDEVLCEKCRKLPTVIATTMKDGYCRNCGEKLPKQRTWTVHWTEHYRMTVPGNTEAEAIEEAKQRLCSKDEGENTETLDFFAEEE